MRRTNSIISKSPLLKNILSIAGGNTVAQLIVIGFSPLITRIYSPDVFGLQGVFLAAVIFLSPLASMRYPMAIVLAEDEREIRLLERLSLLTATGFALLTLVALLTFGDAATTLLGLEGAGPLVYLLPLALVLVVLQEIELYKATRRRRFHSVSTVTAMQALSINGMKVIGGLWSPTATTLLWLACIGPGLHASMLRMIGGKRSKEEVERLKSKTTIRSLARRHRDFPLLRTPSDLLTAGSHTVPVILLGLFFAPAVAGFYTLARSVMDVPSRVLGNAIGNVFYEHFARLERNNNTLYGIALKATALLLAGPGFLIVLTSILWAPGVFAFAFGDEWRVAGVYAQWMSVGVAVALANVPCVRLAPVIGAQGHLLTANAITLVLRVGAIVIAMALTGDPLVAVAAFSIANCLSYLGLIVWMLLLARAHDERQRVSVDAQS